MTNPIETIKRVREQTGNGSGKLIADLKSWKERGCGESASERTPQQIKNDAYCDGWLDGFAAAHQSATEQMKPLVDAGKELAHILKDKPCAGAVGHIYAYWNERVRSKLDMWGKALEQGGVK